ncbi:hypothetical protein OESDEN_21274 [Oesophagostomum dentatum]|nr:hypothetical protein OESDEN_21274 [Oesophagostomum dentatum]
MFGTLFVKGTLTFTKNNEIRMTLHAAVVSLFELIFFLYWEYGPTAGLPDFWRRACDGYSILIYFDILILPYLILNNNVKAEVRAIFCGRRRASMVKISSLHMTPS